MTKGALSPSRRRLATKVVIFQGPCGMALTRRAPRCSRPRVLAMLVAVPVSSMKTRRAGSSPLWLCRQACRAAATSGRACSAACAVFFKTDAMPVEEPPDRRDRRRQPALAEPGADLLQRQIGRLGDQLQKPLAMPLDRRRTAIAALRHHACTSLTTKLGLTAKLDATRRTLSPASICRTTRSRRSTEYGRVIPHPPRCRPILHHPAHIWEAIDSIR